jgi:hypothetical protein
VSFILLNLREGFWKRVLEKVLEKGFGKGFWKRVLEKGFGKGFWKRVLEKGFGKGFWKRVLSRKKPRIIVGSYPMVILWYVGLDLKNVLKECSPRPDNRF